MARFLLAALLVLADTAMLAAGRTTGVPLWVLAVYALAAAGVVAVRTRSAALAFVATLVLASLSGRSYILLMWAGYQAGRGAVSRSGTAVVAGAALGYVAERLVVDGTEPRALADLVATGVVFVILPFLIGRYLEQHHRLVTALDRHNRQLRWEQELLGERERLRERLRIARDMHDSLGHRLGLLSVQAAALEVADLPPAQHEAVRRLANAARDSMDELHELVGTLRRPDDGAAGSPGQDRIGELIEGFRAAGVQVGVTTNGTPGRLRPAVGQAAYRTIEEGLTNAAKHAAGERVTVTMDWEADALLLTIVNRTDADAPAEPGGHGLVGLAERAGLVGGFLDVKRLAGEFRMVAMLPVMEDAADEDLPDAGRLRTVALGVAIAALVFLIVPAGMVVGVG